ncbi:MAG TPA: hypothetical protein VMU62_03555 [Acidobacteriaceae bacterium]|nr:hypothetical protein [Acidobacteriaceae bacterium]
MINRIAMEKLPADMPAFLQTPQALREVEYLGPEPDRWRSPAEPELNDAQAPEHFINLEVSDTLEPHGLPSYRFEFLRDAYVAAFGLQKQVPSVTTQFLPQHVGLLPWQATEVYERLQADMRHYRARLAAHKNTYGVEQAILFDIGWLGHYVGDGSQPLHTSINYNGWAQRDNPNGYSRAAGVHARFETVFVEANLRESDVKPLVPTSPLPLVGPPFAIFVTYLRLTHQQVDEVYQLDQQGGFRGAGSAQSRAFTAERLAAGATMLRDMIVAAWQRSGQAVTE